MKGPVYFFVFLVLQEKSLQQLRKRHVIRKLASGRRNTAYAIAKARGNAARMAAPLSLEEVVTLLQRRWQARKLALRDAAAIEHWKTAYAPNTFVRRRFRTMRMI